MAGLLGLLLGSPGLAQTVLPAPGSEAKKDDPIELSPFVITSTQDTGYQATTTLAGTRLNTNLKDVGAAVSVYTAEFLADIHVTRLEDILTYTTSTEGGGQNGNFAGFVGENSAEVRDATCQKRQAR